ncbi:AraC family transcriptional regulator [Paenibacillus sp. VCA1]|uniref:helix-turn-helix transcriptional regulator n=1 Tax=Paenibacillus sp. VCA1 TaxID=3039148 RepID=UPI00287181F2|nr:AraC family transcriptional regulator [Paenibacillus sp. VCA1]MDR9854850.1 AraC family transcriptional regulator [Paenibacillus sp. VCA1]
MTHPKELWENTLLENSAYPFQLFQNRCTSVPAGECVLYLHWHEHFEFLVMKRGNAVFHIDSRPYVLQEGEVALIPGGSLHVGYSLAKGDVHYDCVVVNASLFREWLHDPLHIQFVAPYLEGRRQFPVKLSEREETDSSCMPLLHDIIGELAAKPPAYPLIVKSKLHLLFSLLARLHMPDPQEFRPEAVYFPNRERFKELIQYVDANFAEKMTVEQAAGQVNLNPYYFCKLFKRLTGLTFIEYVNTCRMKEARRLLLATNDSVTDIAAKVGCENPNYFTKMYKRYIGLTPSQTRKG